LLLNPFIAVYVLRALPRRRPGTALGDAPDLSLVLLTAAPFAAYLVLHALHDRVQAHWPVPIYPALAIAAAAAAGEAPLGRALSAVRAVAAPFGLGLSALALLHLALPASDLPRIADPASQVRGWPAFAAAVEADRRAGGAGWVGALSYGVTAQLAAQPAIRAPVLELVERERYAMNAASTPIDLSRPGLVVDLDRRVSAAKLRACFATVRPLGPLARGAGVGHDSRYALFLVAGPRSNILAGGCPIAP
jgi:hypothetical protein